MTLNIDWAHYELGIVSMISNIKLQSKKVEALSILN